MENKTETKTALESAVYLVTDSNNVKSLLNMRFTGEPSENPETVAYVAYDLYAPDLGKTVLEGTILRAYGQYGCIQDALENVLKNIYGNAPVTAVPTSLQKAAS